jgi:hypothetical protein
MAATDPVDLRSKELIFTMKSHLQIFEEFRARIQILSVNDSLVTPHWANRCREFSNDVEHLAPNEFLRWPSFRDFSIPEFWVFAPWYDALCADEAWGRRWQKLTREVKLGHPHDFSRDLGTSPLLIQHAYHLKLYEDWTRHSLIDTDVIVEFGGGYGSFARLLRNAGFNGCHIIYDLQHMLEIQRLFLTLLGADIIGLAQAPDWRKHAICLVSDADLDSIVNFLAACPRKVTFVATWSLSESPINVREEFLGRLADHFDHFLIAYQDRWEEIDNCYYFSELRTTRSNFLWREAEIPHYPRNFYLFS